MKLVLLTLIFLSLILCIRYLVYFQTHIPYRAGQEIHRQITLLSSPTISDFSQSFKLDTLQVKLPRRPEYHYGDSLEIVGVIEEDTFLDSKGVEKTQLVIKNPQIQRKDSNMLVKSAAFLRSRIMSTFSSYLPPDEAALLFGIVVGGSQQFSRESKDAFRNSGVLHVVAASGMNVSMVAAFLMTSLSIVLKRRTALLIAVAGVFYYALLSGFSASIVRASIMATIAFSAAILGRQNSGFLALLLTAFLMLFLQPETIFDIGFLLSFTSTLGILLVKPFFDSIKTLERTKVVTDDISTTVSAQVGSIPVMIVAFGSYSFISVLVNALVLWTIPFLMILGGIAAICSIALPFVSVPFLYLSYPLLYYFKVVAQYFGAIPMVELESIPVPFTIGYYLILFGTVLYWKRRRDK